jgi:DNA-binding NarL/FixJ family response regulator
MPASVLLADDHQIVRQGLRVLLEREGFEVVGEAADGHEAVELATRLRPEVAVLDFVMPRLNGLDAAVQIHKASSSTRTVLLTMYTEDQYVLEAFRHGLRGYVIKTQAAADLVLAIREILRNALYLSPGISRTVVDAYLSRTEVPEEPLTPREREVLQLVAEGRTTKEIANLLGLSVKTAETHRTRIMRKLEIHETAGLVRYAIRRGLVRA